MSTERSGSGAERRRSARRPVVETFSFFVVLPKKGGIHRLPIHDVSELGLGFDFDISGESLDIPVKKGENLDVHLYLNQSLYISIPVEVARIEEVDSVRRIGAQFIDRKSKNYKAFSALLQLVDQLVEIAKIKS